MVTLEIIPIQADTASPGTRNWKDPRPSKESWKANRQIIHQKYVTDGLPLRELRQYMRLEHDFHAKERQYTVQLGKWGFPVDVRTQHRIAPTRPLPYIPGESSTVLIHLETADESIQLSGGPGCPDDEYDISNDLSRLELNNLDVGQHHVHFQHSDCYSHRYVPSLDKNKIIPQRLARSQLTTSRLAETSGAPASPKLSPSWQPSSLSSGGEGAPESPIESSTLRPDLELTILSERTFWKGKSSETQKVEPHARSMPLTILQNAFRRGHPQSESTLASVSDVASLVTASNFLFAAQSYHDSFIMSQATQCLIEQNFMDSESMNPMGNLPAWLVVAINMARSAFSPEHFQDLLRVMKKIKFDDVELDASSEEYGLLYAYLGCATYRLSNHPQAKNVAAASWNKLRSMPPTSYLITRRIIAPAIEDIMGGLSHIQPGFLTLKEFRQVFCVSSANTKEYIKKGHANNDIRCTLNWASESLTQQEFDYMISNIDAYFWSGERGVEEHDIRQFELTVVHCYLCERLWQSQRSRHEKICGTSSALGIHSALKRLHQHIGLSHEDIIASMVNLLTTVEPSAVKRSGRSTMPTRFHTAMDSLRHQSALNHVGYGQENPAVTLDRIIEQYTWPGKACEPAERFHNVQYGQCVRIFLQEFLSVSFELDLSQRLRQVDDGFRALDSRSKTAGILQSLSSSTNMFVGSTSVSDETTDDSKKSSVRLSVAAFMKGSSPQHTGSANQFPIIQQTRPLWDIAETKTKIRNFSRKLARMRE